MRFAFEGGWNAVARCALSAVTASALLLGAAGCSQESAPSGSASASAGSSQSESSASTADAGVATEIDESLYDLDYTKRDKDPSYDVAKAVSIALAGATATSDSDAVSVEGSTVAIGAEGVYVLSGKLDGQVVVNAPEEAKVQLVLDNADIANENGSAIYVQQADKCFITLAEGSGNSVSDGTSYAFDGDEDEPDAAIFSECDLTLQGAGSLDVTGSYNDAVKTKDDLAITGGSYAIVAKGDGLVGKDSVKIADGMITVKADEGDAVKSSKDDDAAKGFVSIDGGSIAIDAGDEGVSAETYLRVADGAELSIVAADDALHSNRWARIVGGGVEIAAGDDAVHAEYALEVLGGTVNVTKCVEGYEAQVITIGDATTHIVASDDGINASTGGQATGDQGAAGRMGVTPPEGDGSAPSSARGARGIPDATPPAMGGSAPSGSSGAQGAEPPEPPAEGAAPDGEEASGNPSTDAPFAPQGGFGDRGGMGGGMGGDPMADSDENCVITVNGGLTVVEAEGDGVDSNGYIYMNGGVVLVSGPTNSGNGSLDYGLGAEVNGGTFLAAGSSGMAETFTGGTQGFALVNASGDAGDEVAVLDGNGDVLAWYTPSKSFQCVIASTGGMVDGESYSLVVGGTSSFGDDVEYAVGSQAEGASVEGGTATEFTASIKGDAGGFRGPGGMGGPGGGQMPDGAGGQRGPRGGIPSSTVTA